MVESDLNAIDTVTRRKLLTLTASGSAFALAGCSGGGSGGTPSDGASNESDTAASNDTDIGGSSEMVDRSLVIGGQRSSDKQQFNPFNPNAQTQFVFTVFYQPLAKYLPNQEFAPMLASEWNIGSDKTTISLRKQSWANGDPVTSTDLVTRLKLGKYFGHPVWDSIESVQETGDRSVELSHVSGSINEDVFRMNLLGMRMSTPERMYGEYLESLEDASSDSEVESAKGELVSWTLKEPPSCGPVKFESASSAGITTPVREGGHPAVDKLNFPTVEWQMVSGHQGGVADLINHKIDVFHGLVTEKIEQRFPDWVTLVRYPVYNGLCLDFNHTNEVLAKREVRQAIAHLVNRTNGTQNMSKIMYSAVKAPHGLPGTLSGTPKQWLGDTLDQLTQYGYDSSNESKAESLLQEAGLQKQNGRWRKENGEKFTLTVRAPTDWSWVRMGQTISDTLDSFGINVDYQPKESSVLYGQFHSQGKWDLITGNWGGDLPHPASSLPTVIANNNEVLQKNAAIPTSVDVPMPVGDTEGSLETVDIQKHLSTISTSTGQEAKDAVKKVTWAINQGLPAMPMNEKLDQRSYDSTEWAMPKKADPRMSVNFPVEFMLDRGIIKAKE
ncbi:ABC transporter substrate-binding protein [Halococcus agarilyticus]|uniref:ABC transporter substrate-binding protein n=1 Tax=Halococcus agarilyticus TaxID=1232219 RepID=UPI0006779E4C|nr:ABC transporter substrate-binding protein [Halococcus agarilyticus]